MSGNPDRLFSGPSWPTLSALESGKTVPDIISSYKSFDLRPLLDDQITASTPLLSEFYSSEEAEPEHPSREARRFSSRFFQPHPPAPFFADSRPSPPPPVQSRVPPSPFFEQEPTNVPSLSYDSTPRTSSVETPPLVHPAIRAPVPESPPGPLTAPRSNHLRPESIVPPSFDDIGSNLFPNGPFDPHAFPVMSFTHDASEDVEMEDATDVMEDVVPDVIPSPLPEPGPPRLPSTLRGRKATSRAIPGRHRYRIEGGNGQVFTILSRKPRGWENMVCRFHAELHDGDSDNALLATAMGKHGIGQIRLQGAPESAGSPSEGGGPKPKQNFGYRDTSWFRCFELQGPRGEVALTHRFEWRRTQGRETDLKHNCKKGFKLVWTTGPAWRGGNRQTRPLGVTSDGKEVVAVITAQKDCFRGLGRFSFDLIGTDLTDKLGQSWRTMAVMSGFLTLTVSRYRDRKGGAATNWPEDVRNSLQNSHGCRTPL
ncbi:hypothetical protein CTRI78_v010695 [Colletotrichum trifolii]|uniref:Uncharacterized protein n=1 Tax=Colletotrichum trifolii TaxID=5466 RepID=A0A4R8QQZ5_COLTR|nr:hypothetical protein CTRI78_v010695 [Colletotrichum trifolii]